MIDRGVEFENVFLIAVIFLLLVIITDLRLLYKKKRKGKLPSVAPVSAAAANSDPKHPAIPAKFLIFLQSFMQKLKNIAAKAGKPFRPVLLFLSGHKFLLINIICLPAIAFLVRDMLQPPGVSSQYPVQDEVLEDYSRPLEVVFNRPVSVGELKPYIFPEIAGEWVFEPVADWLPFFKRKVKFVPKESMFPNEKVFVYYAGISNILGTSEKWEFGTDAKSPPLPEILTTEPAKDALDVQVSSSIIISLDRNPGSYVSWELTVEPKVEFTLAEAEKKLVVTFANSLNQGQAYVLKASRIPQRYNLNTSELLEKGEAEQVLSLAFTTVKEPLISSIEPAGDKVFINTPIRIIFDNEMVADTVEKGFTLEPAVPGKITWENKQTFVYSHDNFAKDTLYKIKLSANLQSVKGGLTQKEQIQEFKTIGPVVVDSFSPGQNTSNVKRGSNISVNFNQEVDHGSAQGKFSISPGVSGAFSWNGNSMIFNPNGSLAYGTTYTITVQSGVKSINGLDSTKSFSSKFTSEVEYFVLNVPIYYQQLRYSCNIEAARMALAYRGVYISVSTGYNLLPHDSTPYDAAANTWGNPYTGFVGDIDGNPKGYGIYWGPVGSSLIGRYRSYTIKTGWNVGELIAEVRNNNPVVIWAHNGYSYAGNVYYWNTTGGQSIRAVTGMHSFVVVGYRGSSDNPTHIILNDSNRGRWTVTRSYFDSLWGYFGNTGIIVR